ncbi:MAG: response regulator [Verrucomicrobia bacterium]|nr:response regulator [Verrucomicrobiota bacterium]
MKKLLIVDDDPHLLESLRVIFDGLYEVCTAPSAEEAAVFLGQQQFDVMLLDVILPGATGVEFLQVVREIHPFLPVVMISGASSIKPVMKALELGASDFVRKPFDIDELRLVVARALHLSELKYQVAGLQSELARRPFVAEPDGRPMKEVLEDFERSLIKKALQGAGGVQTRAAEVLGTTRRILSYRIGKLKISSVDESA